MAKEYGLYGFVIITIGLMVKRLMERPVDEIISRETGFPFMICWANKSWARNWDGGFKHLEWSNNIRMRMMQLTWFFMFSYIFQIEDIYGLMVSLFAIYKAHLLPDVEKTIKIWRGSSGEASDGIVFSSFEHTGYNIPEYLSKGFDMSINFQPFCMGKFQHCKVCYSI